jgi:hypothetical protein
LVSVVVLYLEIKAVASVATNNIRLDLLGSCNNCICLNIYNLCVKQEMLWQLLTNCFGISSIPKAGCSVIQTLQIKHPVGVVNYFREKYRKG